MYQLYYQPGTASFVVHWLLIELQLDHELKLVDFASNQQKSADYLKLNPGGVVPTLLVDGQAVSEFAGICMYLTDRHAAGQMAPAIDSTERATYNQWMFYVSNTIQPTFRLWFYPQELGHEDAIKPIIQAKLESYFARTDQHLADGRKFLLGEQMSTADMVLTMVMRWSRNMPKPADSWPHLQTFATRMKALPSFQTVNQREGLTDWQ